jgi:hypothetical protein
MRLSEAIRLGALLKPQGFNDYWDGDGNSCAIGAAADALGVPMERLAALENQHKRVLEQPCPACDRQIQYGESTVTHLNDDHRWTRERIADWVETIEARSEQPVESPVTVAAVDPVAAS